MKQILIIGLTILGYTQAGQAQAKLVLREKIVPNKSPLNNTVAGRPANPAPGKGSAAGPLAKGNATVMPSSISGVYEFSKRMSDGTIIKQGLKLGTDKVALTRPLDNVAPSDKAKKIGKKDSYKATTVELGNGWEDCTTQEVRLSVSNLGETMVDYSGQMANIYPGAVYRADDYLKGTWNDINTGRNPLTIVATVKNTGEKSPAIPIRNPDRATIAQATNELYNSFTNEPSKTPQESFTYKIYEVENEASFALKTGASGHYFGVKVSALFGQTERSKHHYLLIDGVKTMFSINVKPDANGIMQNPTNDMMYISNVTYGARILAVAEIDTYNSNTMGKGDFSAEYLVGGGEFTIDDISSMFNKVTKINYYVVGGKSEAVSSVYSFNELKASANEIFRTLNYHLSQPISYSFRNMNNDEVKRSSATDYFLSQSCVFRPKDAPAKDVTITAAIQSITAVDFSETDLEIYGQVWAQVFDGNGKEVFPSAGKDRLLDILPDQHLQKENIRGSNYKPGIKSTFTIPGSAAKGARLIIYYWMMEYDGGSGDDFLTMQNGNGTMKTYNKNNMRYYSSEIRLDNPGEYDYNNPVSSVFVDRDGESAIRINLSINKTEK